MFSVQQEIENRKKAEGTKVKPVKALDHPVNARPHTNVYKMHRYYARRPWNVFEHLILHYTEPGDIILDPFCGGGVTVIEGLKLRRKVIGVDLNPLATFITKMEVTLLNLDAFQKAFREVETEARDKALKLYTTTCPECKNKNAVSEWYEWSNVFQCPACESEVVAFHAKKVSAGRYTCTNKKCKQLFKPLEVKKLGEELIQLYIRCEQCGHHAIYKATMHDKKLAKEISDSFDETIRKEKLWYPKEKFPDGDRQRDDALFQKGITHFYQLFTKRNLLANARLLKAIREYDCDQNIKEFLYFCFSSSLRFTNRMCFRNEVWRGEKYLEWAGHAYWIPDVQAEGNAYLAFANRLDAIVRGKQQSAKESGDYCQFTESYQTLNSDKTCLILTQSAHEFSLPDESVDALITDPPFGGNVQYAELSNFWVVWLQDVLDTKGIIDNSEEAIQTRHTGFETEKSIQHYEDMLYKIFKECYRIMRSNGWLVMTFHNRDIDVWMALHRAANRAGFYLPTLKECENRGMIYQPPIDLYTTTFHQRATGSMLGDFILSFKKMERITDLNKIRTALTKEQEKALEEKIRELIEFHGGADDTTVMTGLIPALQEVGVFRQVAGFDWQAFLSEHFVKDKKSSKWITKEIYEQYFDEKKNILRPIDYIQAEHVTKELILSFLLEKKRATMDELLSEIYTKLVNSHRPGVEAIQSVLNKYCEETAIPRSKKKGYRLKTEKEILTRVAEPKVVHQYGIWGETSIVQDLSHDQIIEMLAHYAMELGYKVHVGETEQKKDSRFKRISTRMLRASDWGISSSKAFDKIKEIDLLILDGSEIPAAFEVATTVETARVAINDRFRDMFVMLPNTKINAFVVVRDEDASKAAEMIYSASNIKDEIADKIKPAKLSYLTKENFEKWLK
ncbi:MAG: hypothetical protein HY707_11760 [Ignavibacteriae bacterium]|nr:hypothetical protein [Ignavibacteriota bacterium]